MNKIPPVEDLRVYAVVARKASFRAAALELGVSPAYVTKRIRLLEQLLATKLLHRTTRKVTVTEEGERVFVWAQRVLDDMDSLVEEVSAARRAPRGLLRVSSSFGFGRQIVAPVLARMAFSHPTVAVRLELFDHLIDIAGDGFDLDVRVGDDIAPQFIATRLAANHRVLCASPAYLQRRGTPSSLADLGTHDCVVIRERDHPFGVWRLNAGGGVETAKVTGPMSTNNGEIAVQWAVEGLGIVLRSIWQVGPLIRDGHLVQVLPGYRQEANVWAVYPTRLGNSAKVRVCVEFLQQAFRTPGS
ncbi:LysR family transcriptional activator of dmlA [Rhodoferax ferrireducens]|uniref:LysR family transcriptional activator of dmlA n=1 Tax=Rhodoferax ferrireducens TaxID=192843 RepID=A0ABU2C5V9_9BURK|nr:LysR substrate-binding domain-containing protein [Rhodoferax ferrireducens]MDR7376719.1 LysR family transcriptional activator of dmlA [Rhodoferax ferrireducens]